jgi:hypothetical protein
MNPQSTRPLAVRLPPQRLATAAALACGVLLSACGGGDGAPPATTTPLSQSDATADAANATSTGADTASAMDTVIDTTSALALATAQPANAAADRVHALAADASAAAALTNVTVNCAGGGTATLSITGGTAASELNGQLDAGEHYSVAYAQCTGQAGYAQLDGSVEMDVVSADHGTSPATLSVNLTVTGLSLTLPAGSATLDGTATVSRNVATAGGTTTTTSHVTVPGATLATRFNSRSGTFTLSDLDATRTLAAVAGVTAASQYTGHHTLSGTADGRTFSMSVSTTGNVSYDATGALVSGQWTVVRPKATVATVVANGTVVITVDDGNDGTIDHTWTLPVRQLDAAAG